jgi:hypothetical protein
MQCAQVGDSQDIWWVVLRVGSIRVGSIREGGFSAGSSERTVHRVVKHSENNPSDSN